MDSARDMSVASAYLNRGMHECPSFFFTKSPRTYDFYYDDCDESFWVQLYTSSERIMFKNHMFAQEHVIRIIINQADQKCI